MFKNSYLLAMVIFALRLGLTMCQAHAQGAPVPWQPVQMASSQESLTAAPLAPGTSTQANSLQATQPQVIYEPRDGIRYRVTRRLVTQQVPVTVMENRSKTVYKQQVKSQTINQQKTFCVPVTEYKKVSKLHGRWNPFVKPYRTEKLKPVTVWKQQVVSVPVSTSQLVWVPETKIVQVPVTNYQTVEKEEITRVAMVAAPTKATSIASTIRPIPNGPSATLVALPNYNPASRTATSPMGSMENVASRSGLSQHKKGWQTIEQKPRRY
jgi:hypothetical protein